MAVVKQTLDLIGRRSWARGPTIQIYAAGNGAAVGESYDYAKAAISLERSNSFPWPKDCVQIHQTLFPPRGWGLGTRLQSARDSTKPRPNTKLHPIFDHAYRVEVDVLVKSGFRLMIA